ncbi:MAG TPA: TldD/PmbA family protein [Bacteroidales bacterium]|nr:MAG: protease TldD [Bacteroidetes bacterium ADurb.Bin139]HOR11732.1 TldD/PmbA family protein [Bacteroidales bacterium]HPB77117.1 TldD/PmbA family protein [Bacteroidales bacterium]HQN81217.1 TldD/PmbA family protein [Bacteroidales bacterium]
MDLTTATDMDSYKLLNLALRKGGDYADLYFEQTTFHSIVLRDGEVNAASTHNEGGLGIRVVSGQNTGYAYTESSLPRDREEAARTASHIAQGLIRTSQPAAIATLNLPDRYRIVKPWEEFSPQEKMPFLYDLNDRIFSADKRVKKVTAQLSDSTSQIEIYNSLGIHCADIRPMASLSVSCVMESGGQRESASSSRSFRMGGEFLTPGLIEELAREIIDRTSFLFGAKQPNGGEMPVVMAAGGSGILLHEAIGHAFEADFARKKVSIFSDMMGKRVCSPGITVIDDGTIAGNRGSLNVDDEGVPGQKTYMVTDGILTSFLHDRISARYFQAEPTGNGRRESFRYMPLPRMRATYMDNGPDTEEALIASVKKGLYVDTFSNGQVQIGAGDFTFYVKSGYLIENGKLTQPIKDTNIIGNGPEALARITGVANNCAIDNGTWTCGKEQSCAVSCGMPSVLVSSLTVGGRV